MNTTTVDRYLQRGVKISFLLLIFLLPLLLSTRSSEVFELPKILFVYGMTAVIVGLWLARMVIRREILIRRTPLDIPILLFLISQIVSTIYSIDPQVSWWGWYGRFHGGLWSTISYTLLYYAFVSNISENSENSESQNDRKSENQKTRNSGTPIFRFSDFSGSQSFLSILIKIILTSGLVVSLYAILQHFGIDKNFWVQDVMNRVFSTQGQPNWLAAYLVMAIPLTLAIGVNSSLRGSPDGHRDDRGNPDGILFMIFTLALLWTKSRSGLIGLAAADGVFWSLIFFQFYLLKKRSYIDQQRSFKKEPTFLGTKKLYRLSTIVHNLYNFVDRDREKMSLINLVKSFVLIHILIAGLILATNNPVREALLRNGIAALPRRDVGVARNDGAAMESGITLRKSEQGGTESGDIRRIVWTGALQLVKQRPLFGFGPETFGETYWRVRPKEHNLTSEWNFLYNKAHNEWLNLAANTGIFGLGAHLLVLGWFSVWSIKRSLLGGRQGDSLINTAILAGLWGVETVNFFGFSTVTVGVYQYLFMGIAVSSSLRGAKDPSLRSGQAPQSRRDCHAPPAAGLAMTRNSREYPSRSILQGLSLWAIAIVVLYIFSRLFIFFLADLSYNRGRAYQDGGYVEEAVEPLTRAVNLAPEEPVFRAELSEAEGALAATLLAQERTVLAAGQGQSLKDDAVANLEIVRKQSPQNLGFIRTEARVLFLLGEQDKAVSLMKQAMSLAPTNPQLPYSLGQMLSKMGNEEEAKVYFNKAVELKPDYQEAIKILNTEY